MNRSCDSALCLTVGGECIRIVSSPEILAAVTERFRAFISSEPDVPSGRAPIVIEVGSRPDRFAPAYERPVALEAFESTPGVIRFQGAVSGIYSVATRRGRIENASGLGALDALLRLALSTALPLGGALLLHGAAVDDGGDKGIALCGASGSGKSTAAAAFGAFCDEHAVLRPTECGLELASTPYWAGRPHRSDCGAVVCLTRGGEPGFVRLRGAAAAMAVARHTVRYVAIETIDRDVLRLVCAIGARVPVFVASCPEGEEFVPFLSRQLQLRRAVA